MVVLILGMIFVGVLGGLYAADDRPSGTIVTTYGSPNSKRIVERPPRGLPELSEEEWEVKRSLSLKRVSKFIAGGIIQRINEAKRQLFVNDAIWHTMSRDRQEHVARTVLEYLDVVNGNSPGTMGVFSFRTGQVLGAIKGGAFVIYH